MARKGLLERVNEAARRVETKTFTQPPFWALDSAQYPWSNAATPTQERIESDFLGYVNGAYKGDGIVFSTINRRQQVFSQGRFQWQKYTNGLPGKPFGTGELALLENPWPNGTTGELLAYLEVMASLAGNAYLTTVSKDGSIGNASRGKPGRWIARLRPDWMTLVIDAVSGDPWGIDAYVAGFLYQPRVYGSTPGASPGTLLLPDEVCHYSPLPDPAARFRGMSWLTPTIKDVQGDIAATDHKLGFFRRGATPSLVVKGIPATSPEQFDKLVTMMEAKHAGVDNSYRTLYLTAGADAAALGADLKQLDFKVTQGGGEVRLAVAGGVPASILGISEGLSGSSLNAGNFGAARRLFVDTTIQNLWSIVAPSLQNLVDLPPGSTGVELTVDPRNIPFMREDATDDANIRFLASQTLNQLLMAGYAPDASVRYVTTGDLSALIGQHSGMSSVQLLPPASNDSSNSSSSGSDATASLNGSGTVTDPAILVASTNST